MVPARVPGSSPASESTALGGGAEILARALSRFGHAELRPGQAEVIADIFSGTPVIGVMPTGAGKSLCYPLPAVVLGDRGGVTLVVSTLIAQMKDQVDALRGRGNPAIALTSQANAEEQREMLEGIRAGMYTLVYVAPERFRSPRFTDALRSVAASVALVAIDEAHCISEWGHAFRPDYRRLGQVIRELTPPRIAAFTATATPEVREDIAVQLGIAGASLHVRGFDRPNLYYSVVASGGTADKTQKLIDLVRTREGGVALVYAATRKPDAAPPPAEVLRGLWKLLAQQPSLGKLMHDDEELEAKLKPHLPGPPTTATIGAAIRILERHGMLVRDDERIAAHRPQPGVYPVLEVESLQRRAEIERKKLRAMVDYAYNPRCRRQLILEYFGDEDWASRDRTCGACDNCDAVAHGRTTGMSDAEQKAARGLLLLVGTLHGRFGRKKIAALANGTEEDARFEDLPERGCIRGWSDKQVMDLLRALEGAGLVEASRGEYPTLATTKRGDLAALGKLERGELGIRMPTVVKRGRKPRR